MSRLNILRIFEQILIWPFYHKVQCATASSATELSSLPFTPTELTLTRRLSTRRKHQYYQFLNFAANFLPSKFS